MEAEPLPEGPDDRNPARDLLAYVAGFHSLLLLGALLAYGVRHLRLSLVRSRVAMRSRCSGVSGGNESTMVRICSARTVAARCGVAGSVVHGGAWVVRADCVREGGTGAGGSV